MSSLRLSWTPLSSYHMTYATVLGYVFEVHSSSVPLFGPPESYIVMCRHLHVVDGPQRTKIGEYGSEDEGKLAAEAWLGEQMQALGLVAPEKPAPEVVSFWEWFQASSPFDASETLEQQMGTAYVAGLTFMEELSRYISPENVGLVLEKRGGETVFMVFHKKRRCGARLDKLLNEDVFEVMTGALDVLDQKEGTTVRVPRSQLRAQAKLVAERYFRD